MRVDLGALPEEGGNFVKGWYSLEVCRVDGKDSGANLECTIMQGPDKDDGTPSDGETTFFFLLYPRPDMKDGGEFAGKNLRRFFTATNFETGLTGSFEVEDLVGLQFDAFGTIEEYEGDSRLKFKNPMPYGTKA